jgi:hypothetical protein
MTSSLRRFNLGDCLILIGAFSLSLAALQSNGWFERFPVQAGYLWRASSELLGLSHWSSPLTRRQLGRTVAVGMVSESVELLSCILLGLTLAQPLIRLRRPRPPLGSVIRQPGFVVCLSVILGTLVMVDLEWVINTRLFFGALWCIALLLVWPVIAAPPWRAEANWVDWLGRGVGVGWIIATLGETTLNII